MRRRVVQIKQIAGAAPQTSGIFEVEEFHTIAVNLDPVAGAPVNLLVELIDEAGTAHLITNPVVAVGATVFLLLGREVGLQPQGGVFVFGAGIVPRRLQIRTTGAGGTATATVYGVKDEP